MSKKRMTKEAKAVQAIYDDLNEAETKINSDPAISELEKLKRQRELLDARINLKTRETSSNFYKLSNKFRTPENNGLENPSYDKLTAIVYDSYMTEFELTEIQKFVTLELARLEDVAKTTGKKSVKQVKRILGDVAVNHDLYMRVSVSFFRPYTEMGNIKTLTKDQLSSLVTSRYHIAVDADGHGIELDSKGNPLEVNPKKSARK